jgi:hypothetical protein
MKAFSKKSVGLSIFSFTSMLTTLLPAQAQEFQSLGNAIKTILGNAGKGAFKKNLGPGQDVYYSKNARGKAARLAFVETGIYKPNCTHTWVVGIDPSTDKVTGIEVVEMSCPHAFPTKEKSFLDQYVGKGPAEARTLIKQIDTIAKATGSCNLTTDAVVRSITSASKVKGTF